MLQTIRHFLELIRFSHTMFALPFALLAALMAWRLHAMLQMIRHLPRTASASATRCSRLPFALHWRAVMAWRLTPFRWQELVGILLCMVAARSFAMAFNRLADRQLDADESAHGRPAFAGRHSERRASGCIRRRCARSASSPARCCSCRIACRCICRCPCSRSCRLQLRQAIHVAGPLLARRGAGAFAGRRLDRHSRRSRAGESGRPAAGARARRRRADLGRRVRHHLRLPGLRRPTASAKLHSVPVRLGIPGALRLAAACHLADDRAAGLPAAGVSAASAGSTGPASRPSRCCWSTSTCWSGRTTFPA